MIYICTCLQIRSKRRCRHCDASTVRKPAIFFSKMMVNANRNDYYIFNNPRKFKHLSPVRKKQKKAQFKRLVLTYQAEADKGNAIVYPEFMRPL